APPSLETKNGAWPGGKLPAYICIGFTGLTPMLGSEFPAVSPLALAGIRSTARRRNGKLDVAVMDHSLSAGFLPPNSMIIFGFYRQFRAALMRAAVAAIAYSRLWHKPDKVQAGRFVCC